MTLEYRLSKRRPPGLAQALPCAPARVARLMALALRLEGLVQQGVARDYADLARLGRVSRPRITQILNLRRLAPDLQERLLFTSVTAERGEPLRERDLRPLVRLVDFEQQRAAFAALWARRATPPGAALPQSAIR
jgi:hypothetical protein